MCNQCNPSATACSSAVDCSCPIKDLSTDCVLYTGDDLTCSGIKKGTILTEFLKQLDAFICSAVMQTGGTFVPYSGALQSVDLGLYDMKVNNISIGQGNFLDHSLVIGELAGGNSVGGGSGNLAIGYKALYSAYQATYQNMAIGHEALSKNTIGQANMGVGYQALKENLDGTGNTALGRGALAMATSPLNCIATGNAALMYGLTTEGSTANGFLALAGVAGNNNTAMGTTAGWGNGLGFAGSPGIGHDNTIIGAYAMTNLSSGEFNVAIGSNALRELSTGASNVAIGYTSLQLSSGTSANTAIGDGSMSTNVTGNYNTVVGAYAQATNVNNCVVLGRGASATASNQFVVGTATNIVGAISTQVNTSTKVWNVMINGVAQKILLA